MGTKTTCAAWAVRPAADGAGELVRDDQTIGYTTTGPSLAITGWSRGDTSTTCGFTTTASESADAVVVDRAHWFRTAASCEQALASKQRVAMNWRGCALEAAAADTDAARARQRFERVLDKGGTMFAIVDDRCDAVIATPSRRRDTNSLEGFLWSKTVDGKVTGKHGYNYAMVRGTDVITMMGPSFERSDGTGGGMGCMGEDHLTFARDAVDLGQRLYLSKASCTQALAHERASAAWLPADDEPADEQVAGTSLPSLGGC